MIEYQQRQRDIIDAASFREPQKIPVGIDITGWAFYYSGVAYRDVMDDPQATTRAYTKFFDDVPIDFTMTTQAMSAPPVKVYEALGCDEYAFSEDGNSVTHKQSGKQFMPVEDYQLLIDDPFTFLSNTHPREVIPAFRLPKAQAVEAAEKAAIALRTYQDAEDMISAYLTEEKQIVGLTDGGQLTYLAPIDNLFDVLRGFRDTLTDLRRRPDTVRAACDAIWEYNMGYFDLKAEDFSDILPFGSTIYHCEPFLSPSQYDEFFFSRFKDTYLPFMEAGQKFLLVGEGRFMETLDRFRQLPKGAMIIQLEGDDPFEAYRRIGDWDTLACGANVDLMATGTKQQCIDYVKRCFDTFAPGGGFMFYVNKEMLSGKDGTIENVVATFETADELSRQH